MPRVKRGVTTHRRHKKIIKAAKGYRGKRKNVFKLAKNAVLQAGQNAYRDRRLKKRSFHQLWVLRINVACRDLGIRYSRFIYGLELSGAQINRKMLSELATNHPEEFKAVVEMAKEALPPEGEAPDLEVLKKKFGGVKKAAPKKTEEKKAAPKKEEKAEEKPKKAAPKKEIKKEDK